MTIQDAIAEAARRTAAGEQTYVAYDARHMSLYWRNRYVVCRWLNRPMARGNIIMSVAADGTVGERMPVDSD